MRAGVRPGAGVWRVVAAEDCPSSQMGSRGANSETALVLCRGTACTAALLLTAEGCVLAALCARERVIGCTYVCGRLAADMCKVLVAGLCGKTERQLLLLLPWLTQETPPLSWLCEGGRPARHKWLYCSEGCRHRGTGQPASLRRSRRPERHRSSTYRAILEVLSWSRRCVPVKKSRSSRGELPV